MCQALKLDPPSLCEITVALVHPKEPHLCIKKTLPVEQKPSSRYRFLKFAKIDDLMRLGFVDRRGSINFRFNVKRNNIKFKLAAALQREKYFKKRLIAIKIQERTELLRTPSH